MLLFIKGIIIGVAAIIPGVSGSVFAVITGVYDDIISKIARIGKNTKDSAKFLIPLAAGIGAGVLLSANPILEICNAYPVYSYSFFIGIMLGSLFSPIKKIKALGRPSGPEILISFGCFLLVILLKIIAHLCGAGSLVAISGIKGFGDFIALLLTGFISVGLMVLPGVSGSVTLMVLGQYGTVYMAAGCPARLLRALIEGEVPSILAAVSGSAMLIPFSVGAVCGFILASRLVLSGMKKNTRAVYCGVVGLISASCVTLVFDGILAELSAFSGGGFLMCVLVLGFLLSGGFLALAFSGDKEKI